MGESHKIITSHTLLLKILFKESQRFCTMINNLNALKFVRHCALECVPWESMFRVKGAFLHIVKALGSLAGNNIFPSIF